MVHINGTKQNFDKVQTAARSGQDVVARCSHGHNLPREIKEEQPKGVHTLNRVRSNHWCCISNQQRSASMEWKDALASLKQPLQQMNQF